MLPRRKIKPKLVQCFLILYPQIIDVNKSVILCDTVREKLILGATACFIINQISHTSFQILFFKQHFDHGYIWFKFLEGTLSGGTIYYLSFIFYFIVSNLSNRIVFIWKIHYYALAFSNRNILIYGKVINYPDLAPFHCTREAA